MGITRAIERALANEDREPCGDPLVRRSHAGRARERTARARSLIFSSISRRPRVPRGPRFRHSPRSGVLEDEPAGIRQRAVEDSRPDRSDDGRRRHAERPARSRDSLPGKHFGFLACGILPARPAASIICRDEGSRARLARVPRGARGRFDRDHAARANSSRAGCSGFCTGICSDSDPRSDVPGNAAAHRRRGSPARENRLSR